MNTQNRLKTMYGFIMACIELYATCQNSLPHGKQGFGYSWLSKQFQSHPPKPSPVSERSAYPLQKYVCFSLLTSGLESLATNLLPLTGPGLRPTVQNSSSHENGRGLECRKVNFLKYLGQGNLPCLSSSSLPFGHFSSPTNIPTHSS